MTPPLRLIGYANSARWGGIKAHRDWHCETPRTWLPLAALWRGFLARTGNELTILSKWALSKVSGTNVDTMFDASTSFSLCGRRTSTDTRTLVGVFGRVITRKRGHLGAVSHPLGRLGSLAAVLGGVDGIIESAHVLEAGSALFSPTWRVTHGYINFCRRENCNIPNSVSVCCSLFVVLFVACNCDRYSVLQYQGARSGWYTDALFLQCAVLSVKNTT